MQLKLQIFILWDLTLPAVWPTRAIINEIIHVYSEIRVPIKSSYWVVQQFNSHLFLIIHKLIMFRKIVITKQLKLNLNVEFLDLWSEAWQALVTLHTR